MNDALGAAGRAHRVIFENLGYEFLDLNLANSGSQEMLDNALKSGLIEFAYSAAGMGTDMQVRMSDGSPRNCWEALGIPFISLKGDSPAYFFARHVMQSPWHACLYFFPDHLAFRKRLPLTRALYGVVPPMPFDLTDKSKVDFRKKERGTLLFLKNGNDPERLVQIWRETLPTGTFLTLTELAGQLAGDLTSESGFDIDAIVTKHFASKGWDIGEFINLRLLFVAQLDDYLRRIKSELVADVIADFPVEIHGFNWEHMDFTRRRATFVPGGDYTASRQLILDSLGMIDMSPNTQLAPHDRVMRAFGLHTFCLTNEQRFFTDNFKNPETFCYKFDRDELREKVANVLARPKDHVEIGRALAAEFQLHRQPGDFGQFMVDTASHVRLACGRRPEGLQDFFVWPPQLG